MHQCQYIYMTYKGCIYVSFNTVEYFLHDERIVYRQKNRTAVDKNIMDNSTRCSISLTTIIHTPWHQMLRFSV